MKLLHEVLAPVERKMTDPCIYVHANGRIMISKSTVKHIGENNSIVIADKDGDIYARFDKNIGFRFSAKTRVFANRPLVEYLAKHYLPAKAQEVYYNENRIIRIFISEDKTQLEDGNQYHRLTKEQK